MKTLIARGEWFESSGAGVLSVVYELLIVGDGGAIELDWLALSLLVGKAARAGDGCAWQGVLLLRILETKWARSW